MRDDEDRYYYPVDRNSWWRLRWPFRRDGPQPIHFDYDRRGPGLPGTAWGEWRARRRRKREERRS